MDHGYRDHAGELPGGQLEAAGAGQLDGEDAEEEGGELLAQAGPDATSKRQVVEASLFVFSSLLAEAVRVERVHVFKDRRSVMGVPDACTSRSSLWESGLPGDKRHRSVNFHCRTFTFKDGGYS